MAIVDNKSMRIFTLRFKIRIFIVLRNDDQSPLLVNKLLPYVIVRVSPVLFYFYCTMPNQLLFTLNRITGFQPTCEYLQLFLLSY